MKRIEIEAGDIEVKDTEDYAFVQFCAKNIGNFVIIEYNEGHEDMSGIFSENDTFTRLFKVGVSGSDKKVLLELLSNKSLGGAQLYAAKGAIKKYRIATDNDELKEELDLHESILNMSVSEMIAHFSYADADAENIFDKNFIETMQKLHSLNY